MAAIIDKINYLGTEYDIADSEARTNLASKATVPEGGADGQVMLKDGDGFKWGLPGVGSEDIVAYGSYSAGATSCAVPIDIPNTDNYTVHVYTSDSNLRVKSIDKTTTQVIVNFYKQSASGSLCVVARKVG